MACCRFDWRFVPLNWERHRCAGSTARDARRDKARDGAATAFTPWPHSPFPRGAAFTGCVRRRPRAPGGRPAGRRGSRDVVIGLRWAHRRRIKYAYLARAASQCPEPMDRSPRRAFDGTGIGLAPRQARDQGGATGHDTPNPNRLRALFSLARAGRCGRRRLRAAAFCRDLAG